MKSIVVSNLIKDSAQALGLKEFIVIETESPKTDDNSPGHMDSFFVLHRVFIRPDLITRIEPSEVSTYRSTYELERGNLFRKGSEKLETVECLYIYAESRTFQGFFTEKLDAKTKKILQKIEKQQLAREVAKRIGA